MRTKVFLIVLALMMVMSLLVIGCAPAEEEEEEEEHPGKAFYKGKTITLHTAVPGSGMDIMSRFMAKYLAERLEATVVVTAYYEIGGLRSFNELWAAKDLEPKGLHMAGHSLATVWQNFLFEQPVALYNCDQLIYLGAVLCPPMCLWTRSAALGGAYPNITALKSGPIPPDESLRMGGASPLGYVVFWGTLAGRWLGLDFKTVVGVGGPGPLKASILKDETDFTNISIHWTETYGVPFFPDLEPVLVLDDKPYHLKDKFGIDVIRTVPPITAHATIPAGEMPWLELMKKAGLYNMPGFAFAPGVEQYKVDYMRQVFQDIVSDPAFLADAKGRFGEFGWHTSTQVWADYQYFKGNMADMHAIRAAIAPFLI